MSRVILALIALLLSATAAAAQEDSRWVWKVIRYERVCELFDCYRRPVYQRVYVPYVHPREYAITYTHPSRQGHCYPVRAVVGLEKYNVDEAKQNAVELWMEQVRLHHGVKWMDPENAIILSGGGKGPDCYLSSTGTRASERLAENIGKRLSQCEFVARPCEPPKSPARRW